jgi:hypothetical protein
MPKKRSNREKSRMTILSHPVHRTALSFSPGTKMKSAERGLLIKDVEHSASVQRWL